MSAIRLAAVAALAALALRPALPPARVAPARPPSPANPNVQVQRVAEGVWAVLRTDPPGLMFEANGVLIVGDDGVAVVDGGSNPESARAMVATLRRLTPLPVRWVISTHWHDDHALGNQVWRDTFPAAEIVAHATFADDQRGDGATNRRLFVENGPRVVASLKARLERNESLDGSPLGAEERASHLSSIALAEHALAQASELRSVPPTRTVQDTLTLRLGARTIVLRHLGRAHTRGDVVVQLPREGVVIAGDLVDWPVPLVGTTSFPLDYGPTLRRLIALRPTRIVPGHGLVFERDAYVLTMARLLESIAAQTRAAVARGETLEQTRRSVDLSPFRRELAGDSRVRGMLFDTYVAGPAVARAWEAARKGG